ncbi:MAG: DUF4878 domain-containing protein [Bacteroidota bacterium]|nr:DUF4878 domain-containing protein [Bacteroidota bacterium]
MKKIILSFATVIIFLLIGCKGGGSDPKGVLMNFMEALGKKDINTAKKYATKDSESMLGMLQMGMSMAPDSSKDKMFDKNNFEYGEAVITGDKAIVPVKEKKTGETTNYTLKKESGDWKVAFDKATMMQMGTDKMKSKGMDMNNTMDSASKMLNNMGHMMDSSKSMTDTSH